MSSSESKSKPASQRKLKRKREEGSVPLVADVSALMTAAILLPILAALMPYVYARLTATFEIMEQAMVMDFVDAVNLATRDIAILMALAIIPLVGAAILISVMTTILYNGGIIFSMKSITPQFERMSPVKGFGRMFGRRSFIETGVAAARLTIWFGFAAILMWQFSGDVFEGSFCGASCLSAIGSHLIVWLALGALLLFLVSSVLEMILQQNIFLHEQRMTASEVKKEGKEMSGSPEVKREQRRLRQEMAEGADSIGIDKANMGFFWKDQFIAIRYHPQLAPIPRVSAKSKSRKKSLAMRTQLEANGFRAIEHDGVIEACFKVPPGGAIGVQGQPALIDGMTIMFK